jgi:hypothetical protein
MRNEITVASVNFEAGAQFLEIRTLDEARLKSACPPEFLQPRGTDVDSSKLLLYVVGR